MIMVQQQCDRLLWDVFSWNDECKR